LSFDGNDKKAVDAMINFVQQEAAVNTGTSQPSSTAFTASAGDPTLLLSLWVKLNAAKYSNAVSESSATCEATDHLAEPTLSHRQNPLSWWATNRQKYPSVAAVARRLLAVPATSVASEHLFSKAGNVITKKRNCLASSKAHSVVFCMDNL